MSDIYKGESWIVPPEQQPEIVRTLKGVECHFRWNNTLIRRFDVGSRFDHILHDTGTEEGGAFMLFFERLDAPNDRELVYYLEQNRYPERRDPMPDQPTLDLYASTQTVSDEDIARLLAGSGE